MTKHLTSHGNSAALVIEKPIMDLLGITMKTPLEITTDGISLVVSPVRGIGREKKFEKALIRINKKYGKTLSRLA